MNRVSEGLTPLDFSHHRTYGSRITAVLKLTNSEHILSGGGFLYTDAGRVMLIKSLPFSERYFLYEL